MRLEICVMKENVICAISAKSIFAAILATIVMFALTGCSTEGTNTQDAFLNAIQSVQSVEAAISFELRGGIDASSSAGSHTVSIRSDGTITSTRSPLPNAYHAEFYSSLLVDSTTTRETVDKWRQGDGSLVTLFLDKIRNIQ